MVPDVGSHRLSDFYNKRNTDRIGRVLSAEGRGEIYRRAGGPLGGLIGACVP